MEAKSVFLEIMAILLLFNVGFILSRPPDTQTTLLTHMAYGGITGLILEIAGIALVAGITVAGSGLNSESIKIAFGVGTILNVLFAESFWGIQIGLGLAMPLFEVFTLSNPGPLGFLGWSLATGIVLTAMGAGILTLME